MLRTGVLPVSTELERSCYRGLYRLRRPNLLVRNHVARGRISLFAAGVIAQAEGCLAAAAAATAPAVTGQCTTCGGGSGALSAELAAAVVINHIGQPCPVGRVSAVDFCLNFPGVLRVKSDVSNLGVKVDSLLARMVRSLFPFLTRWEP